LRAIASEPMNSTAHLWYGEQLHSLGLVRKGIDETLIAYQLDPLHPGTNASLGHMYLSVGDINNALGYGSIASDLGHNLGFFIQARSYLHLGQFDRAIELATQFDAQFDERFDRQLNKPNTPIEKLFIEAKRDAEKRAVFFETHAEYEKELGLFYLPSYVGFGRIDHAYSVVNTKTNPIASNMLWLFWEPEMAAFRQDPRFAELVSKLGLLDYWREYGWPDACQPAGDSLICE
jgi:tetratricopeptide (TPR) repeat protein